MHLDAGGQPVAVTQSIKKIGDQTYWKGFAPEQSGLPNQVIAHPHGGYVGLWASYESTLKLRLFDEQGITLRDLEIAKPKKTAAMVYSPNFRTPYIRIGADGSLLIAALVSYFKKQAGVDVKAASLWYRHYDGDWSAIVKEETVEYDGLCWDCLLNVGHGGLLGESPQYHFFAKYKTKAGKTALRRLVRGQDFDKSYAYNQGLIYENKNLGQVDLGVSTIYALGTFVQPDGTRVMIVGREPKQGNEELVAFGFKDTYTTAELNKVEPFALLSTTVLVKGANVYPKGMLHLSDGGFAVYGLYALQSYLGMDGILWRFGAHLEQRWVKKYLPQGHALLDAKQLDDGSLITLSFSGTSPHRSHVQRVDSWGHDSCATAGKCADIKLAGCNDSNPCTTDTCTKSTGGCSNKALKEDTPCGVGKKCSLLGFCQ